MRPMNKPKTTNSQLRDMTSFNPGGSLFARETYAANGEKQCTSGIHRSAWRFCYPCLVARMVAATITEHASDARCSRISRVSLANKMLQSLFRHDSDQLRNFNAPKSKESASRNITF